MYFVLRHGNWRIANDAAGIYLKKKLNIILRTTFLPEGEECPKARRAVSHVVSVGGDDMGKTRHKDGFADNLRGISETPEQTALVELDYITLCEPTCNKTRIILYRSIAFGMCDNGDKTTFGN